MTSPPSQERIGEFFDQAHKHYDRANTAMSFGLHRLWKRYFARSTPIIPHSTWVDIGTGTGDIAIALYHTFHHYPATFIGYDPNKEMIAIAKDKALNSGTCMIDWIIGDATALPWENGSIDGFVFSFSLRNIVRWEKALQECFRCTRSSGRIRIMEFNSQGAHHWAPAFEYYRRHILPTLGALASGVQEPYTYLAESIAAFAPPHIIQQTMRRIGWQCPNTVFLNQGVVAIYEGVKP